MRELTNSEVRDACIALAKEICEPKDHKSIKIFGVPRGGVPVAYMLAGFLPVAYVVDTPEEADIIVDDILDSGETQARYRMQYDKPFYTLFEKSKVWIHFPWEKKDERTPIADNIIRIEQFLDSANDIEKEKIFSRLNEILEVYAIKR